MSRKTTGATGCAICGKPVDSTYRPFCSRRCANVDLGRWMTGGYAIPTNESAEPAEDPQS